MTDSTSSVAVERCGTTEPEYSNTIEPIYFDKTGKIVFPKTPQCFLLVGKPSSGKSVTAKNLLYEYLKDGGYYKFGIVVSPTAKFSGDFDFLPDSSIWSKYEEAKVLGYVAKLAQYRKDHNNKLPPPSFLLFDDCLGSINFYSPEFSNFLACYRHYNLSIYFVSQYLSGFGSSTLLREICTAGFIFTTQFENSLKVLYKAFGGIIGDYDIFKALVQRVGEQKHHCVLYIANQNTKEQTYYDFKATIVPDFKINFSSKPKPKTQ
jgi:hypothetical protein